MRLSHFYKLFFLVNIFFIFSASIAISGENIDQKVKKLTLELRCMTCQNQSIYDSEAEFSNDIKKIVKTKFEEGKSEKEIKQFLVQRYGEYILFRPILDFKNMFLWIFPFILLIFSLLLVMIKIKKK